MREADIATGPDLEEATALEIGMTFLKAQLAASEAIAEAEQLARAFVSGGRRGAGLAPDRFPREVGAAAGPELDLSSLAAQVDEIERSLLSNHERILRLFEDGPYRPQDGEARSVDEVATTPDVMTEVGHNPDPPSPEMGFVPTSGSGGGSANGLRRSFDREHDASAVDSTASDAPVIGPSPSSEPEPDSVQEPVLPIDPDPQVPPSPTDRATSALPGWSPPDPSSRVEIPARAPAAEEVTRFAAPHLITHQVTDPVPPSVSDRDVIADGSGASSGGPDEPPEYEHQREAVHQPAAWLSEPSPAVQSRLDTNAEARPKASSSLWLLNVVGFSVLLIVAVVVLMLADVL